MTTDQPWGTKQNPLAICAASDELYAEGLLLTLATVLWSLPARTSCELILLDAGILDVTRESLVKEIDDVAERKGHTVRWSWRTPELDHLKGLPPLRGNNYSTYARLFLCEETELDSLLWIDCDILVFRNLLDVAEEIRGNPLIAGCVDTGVKVVGNETPVAELGDSTLPYLNAGFLWMNLKRMREESFAGEILNFIETYRETLRFHDQTALNSFVGEAREILHGSNNYLCAPWYRDNSALLEDFPQKNLHYLGGDKPWMESQRLSCYTRNLVYHYTRKLLLGHSCPEGVRRTSKLVSRERLLPNVLGLIRQLVMRESEGTEDRFQSIRELHRTLGGHYEDEIREKLDEWYQGNKLVAPAFSPQDLKVEAPVFA